MNLLKLSSCALLALLLTGPVMAQAVTFQVGDRVEALNPATGTWELATINVISAGRYILRSLNASIEDWDVGIADIRIATPEAAQPAPAETPAPAQSVSGNGPVPGGNAVTPAGGSTP